MTEPNRNKRARLTGKGGGASFISLPHFVLNSSEFAALSGNELKVLMELARQYKGSNNGDFSATREQLLGRGWNSHWTIDRGIAGLEAKGWIVKTRQGGKHVGCTLYAITFWAVDECNGKHQWPPETKPSHAWKQKSMGLETGQRRPGNWAAKALAA